MRRDFALFAQRAFHALYPRTDFVMNWHIRVIAARLAAVRLGEIRRLAINLPPRHLKSHLASVAFPAWILGHEPSAEIICVSYAQELADKWSRDCRRIVASPWYRWVFPTRLARVPQAMAEFETTAGGRRVATGLGGVLTGRGADLIVIDDPLKPEEALSDLRRRSANEWYDSTLYSRLNDKARSAVVLVMHRLHEEDLAGHVLAQEDWEILRFSVVAEGDETHRIATVEGPQVFSRRVSGALQPAREPLAMLDAIRHQIGEYNFAGQYQQAPAPLGGGMVKANWFRRYRPDERPAAFERVVQSWVTANKPASAKGGGRGRANSMISASARAGASPARTSTSSSVATPDGLSGAEARDHRRACAVEARCRADRGQGLGDAADPGTRRRLVGAGSTPSPAIGRRPTR